MEYLYIVNLFSGHRRPFDVQHCMEVECNLDRTVCICVDVVHDPVKGDVSRPDSAAFWMSLAASGKVIGCMAGPPCETWCAMRWAADGPPALRRLEQPWGRPGLHGRYAAQVEIGNLLLRFTWLFALMVAGRRGFALVEHPAEPVWEPRAASSWRLPEVGWITEQLGAVKHYLDQCSCGAEARKPTTLWAANLPSMPRRLNELEGRGYCSHESGHAVRLIGKGENGQFRTAPAKVYPPRLCLLIATVIKDYVDACVALAGPAPDWGEDAVLTSNYVALDPFAAAAAAAAAAPRGAPPAAAVRHHGRPRNPDGVPAPEAAAPAASGTAVATDPAAAAVPGSRVVLRLASRLDDPEASDPGEDCRDEGLGPAQGDGPGDLEPPGLEAADAEAAAGERPQDQPRPQANPHPGEGLAPGDRARVALRRQVAAERRWHRAVRQALVRPRRAPRPTGPWVPPPRPQIRPLRPRHQPDRQQHAHRPEDQGADASAGRRNDGDASVQSLPPSGPRPPRVLRARFRF